MRAKHERSWSYWLLVSINVIAIAFCGFIGLVATLFVSAPKLHMTETDWRIFATQNFREGLIFCAPAPLISFGLNAILFALSSADGKVFARSLAQQLGMRGYRHRRSSRGVLAECKGILLFALLWSSILALVLIIAVALGAWLIYYQKPIYWD